MVGLNLFLAFRNGTRSEIHIMWKILLLKARQKGLLLVRCQKKEELYRHNSLQHLIFKWIWRITNFIYDYYYYNAKRNWATHVVRSQQIAERLSSHISQLMHWKVFFFFQFSNARGFGVKFHSVTTVCMTTQLCSWFRTFTVTWTPKMLILTKELYAIRSVVKNIHASSMLVRHILKPLAIPLYPKPVGHFEESDHEP